MPLLKEQKSRWFELVGPSVENLLRLISGDLQTSNWAGKLVLFFLAFDFCRFCVVIWFFIPATTANDLRLRRISIPDFIHYIYFPILILEKQPVFFPFECVHFQECIFELNCNQHFNGRMMKQNQSVKKACAIYIVQHKFIHEQYDNKQTTDNLFQVPRNQIVVHCYIYVKQKLCHR